MCFTNNYIELQAYEMCEKIRENSSYKVVKIVVKNGDFMEIQAENFHWNGKDLITKIILQDQDGNYSYSIKPDSIGFLFAKGILTYPEYKRIQKKEDLKGYSYIYLTIVFFVVIMGTFISLST